jgi:hypothetical protein
VPARILVRVTPIVILAAATTVLAHEPPRPKLREIVLIQGYREAAPANTPIVRTLELVVLGEPHQLHATEWRQFRLDDKTDAPSTDAAERPARLTLQGDRPTLRRFGKARPEQLVTVLAERRFGSADLFVVALDLCPPD